MKDKINSIVTKQHEYFNNGNTLSYEFRLGMLKRLKNIIKKYEKDIHDALNMDLGKHEFESYATEISIVYSELNHAIGKLKKWMRPKKVRSPIVSFGAVSRIYNQPYGVVLVMSPWNYPFMLSMAPVVAAIAAGNCVTIKPSSYSVHTSALLEKMIFEAFDHEYISVFQGNREINRLLLDQKFDYIFFTGGATVGRIVLEAAAKNLTPVTLELGGKSPCIVDKETDLAKTAARIVWGKAINSGQSCIAPDYLIVHEDIKDDLVLEMKKAKNRFFGEKAIHSEDYGKIIREKAFDGLVNLLDGHDILEGGHHSRDNLKLDLTLVDNPPLDSPLMQKEIFGPILPVLTFRNLQDIYDIINKSDKPLALYLFTNSKKLISEIVRNVRFGGGCINDTMMHIANGNMPFGGIGESGMGGYHGRNGFDTFTHKKSVLKQNFIFDLPFRYAPYRRKVNLLRLLIK